VVGPVVLGRDPADVAVLLEEMKGTSAVRGHDVGYQADAIAGIDTALWDVIGRASGKPVGALLGGRFRETLPMYASGLRSRTAQQRCDEARQHVESGFGVKVFLGKDWRTEAREIAGLRSAMGEEATLLADALWAYRPAEALYLGQALQDHGVQFFEAPTAPRDIRGHTRIAARLSIPVAIGELLRNRSEFLTWMIAEAAGVYQPDVMHLGVSETAAVAGIAHAMNAPVALHVGGSTIVGMAATWQVASALPNFLIQEHQPVMFSTFSRWLREPVSIIDGQVRVPTGPGLGIDIDEEQFGADVAGWFSVDEDGHLTRSWRS
jgi:galactonate dehydratase